MSAEMDEKRKTIFLVEDNKADIRLIQEALKNSSVPHQVVTVRDGMDAMAYLRQEGEYAEAPRPDLILLDLNLPKKDGREVLAEIKADPKLKRIPVVVLTTSHNEDDIFHSYDLHVNCYITKSRNLSQLFKIVNGGTVRFQLIGQEQIVVFQIQDEGIGIPKEDQPLLFKPFYRASNVDRIPGTGLGLAIVKKCVDTLGGEISVHSEIGVGTTFAVTLPITKYDQKN